MSQIIPKGKRCYAQQKDQVNAEGFSISEVELDNILRQKVVGLLSDDSGKEHISQALLAVTTTEFETERLREILNQPSPIYDWQVGEAIAEAWLTDHRNCNFPWPTGRDLRNKNASPAGADLVGFQSQSDSYRFAFGEVKTSTEAKYPPGVVTGRHNVIEQLETLRDSSPTKHQLFTYLAHRAPNATWHGNFQQAAKRYLNNGADVALFGLLIRDVRPDVKDVQKRLTRLAKGRPAETHIEILALYLPPSSIDKLEKKVLQLRAAKQ
jgi:hypothetical protein